MNHVIALTVLLPSGDVVTLGNHVWRRPEIAPYLERSERVIRVAPVRCQGHHGVGQGQRLPQGGVDGRRQAQHLRRAGLGEVAVAERQRRGLAGDRADVAGTVGRVVGVDAVLSDCDPADKLVAGSAVFAAGKRWSWILSSFESAISFRSCAALLLNS